MGEKIENGTIHVGEIIGKTLDGKDIYKFTELGMAENVKITEPQYKDGDFVVNEGGSVLIFKKKVGYSIYDHAFLATGLMLFTNSDVPSGCGVKRYATETEKQELLDALAKIGQGWNEEKKCIEYIPKHKFKKGDKVRIKNGISSRTVDGETPLFNPLMDELIGTTMTVDRYTDRNNYVVCDESCWRFREEWLEPYVEELKKGDLAIFWDNGVQHHAFVRMYDGLFTRGYYDTSGVTWDNAIRFESKEQFEKLIKGEL